MERGLKGKVAIVTEASKGLGKAIAAARTSYINGVLVQVDGGATRCI